MNTKTTFGGEVYSQEYYDTIFSEIRELSSNLSPEEINQEIQKRINLTILIGLNLKKSLLEVLELYRARVPGPNEEIKEDEISFYYYPPNEDLIGRGRANIEKQQVFYAAADAHTSFHEMADYITLGSTIVYLSTWGIRNHSGPVFMRNLFLGVPEDDENNNASVMAKGLKEVFETILSDIPEQHRNNFIYGQKKYAELFTASGKTLYHISSAIAHDTFVNALQQGADIPILTYPSVAKDKTAVNFVIRKDFADKYIYLKEVHKVMVKTLSKDNITTTIISKGIVEDGKVKWLAPQMDVEFTDAFVSPNDRPQNMRALQPSESFTLCCRDHLLNTNQLLEKMGFTKSNVLDLLDKVPINLTLEEPQIFDCLIPIKIDVKLYLDSNISENGKINYLMLPIRCTFSYHNNETSV